MVLGKVLSSNIVGKKYGQEKKSTKNNQLNISFVTKD